MIPAAYLERPGFLRKQFYELRRGFKRLWLMRGFYKDNEGIVSWYDAENPPRLFDFGNALGMFMQPAPPLIDEAYQRLFRILSAMQTICKQHRIIFAVEIFPQRFQVQPPDWESAVEKYRISKGRFDLMNLIKFVNFSCNKISPSSIQQEMAKYYAKSGNNMYLPFGDMHWNKTGHRAFLNLHHTNLVQEGFQQAQDRFPSGTPTSNPSRSIGHQRKHDIEQIETSEACLRRLKLPEKLLLTGAGLPGGLLLLEGLLQVYNPLEIRFKPDRIVLPTNKRYLINNTGKFTKLPPITTHTKIPWGFAGSTPADFIT
jgi:hypothetical protein